MTIEIYDLAAIPLYNEDVRAAGEPASVRDLRAAIAAGDALLIATPEYNYSIPGVLKNAIDWVSRPPAPPLADKPVAILGASGSGFGTVRAQLHLRQYPRLAQRAPAEPAGSAHRARRREVRRGGPADR